MIMYKAIHLTLSVLLNFSALYAQQPHYTEKHFVDKLDTSEFKLQGPIREGLSKSFLETKVTYEDLDDGNTTFIKMTAKVLLAIEGPMLNNKREGEFKFFLIDKDNHKKKYLIWTQDFKNDQLNGLWKTYTLAGTLSNYQTYKSDLVCGVAKNYWIDGKTLMSETNYTDEMNYVIKEYYNDGTLKSEIPYVNRKLDGIGKKYYPNGVIQEYVEFKNGEFDGVQKYFYDNGQLWIDHSFKNGKHWSVFVNYTKDGKKRNPGTLYEGNGTVIYYNDDGTTRETETYLNGELKQ